MAITKEKAIDILERFDLFQGQRAGRELWNDKPFEVQEQDVKDFARDVALLKEYIADVVPKSEVENLKVLLEMNDKAYESLKELYDMDTEALIEAREKTELEVAREIFEDIKICMKNFEDDDDGYLLKKCEFEFFMRELEKKYAEDKE